MLPSITNLTWKTISICVVDRIGCIDDDVMEMANLQTFDVVRRMWKQILLDLYHCLLMYYADQTIVKQSVKKRDFGFRFCYFCLFLCATVNDLLSYRVFDRRSCWRL